MYYQILGTDVRIMGTLHYFPFHEPPLPVPAWAAAAEKWASQIAVETDNEALKTLLLATPSDNPKQYVPDALWTQLSAYWPAGATLDRSQLWALMLGTSIQLLKVTPGMEAYISSEIATSAKPVSYLESAAELLAHAQAIPKNDLVTAISVLLAMPELPQANLEKMYVAWANCDLDGLYAVAATAPMFQISSVKAGLLQDRNKAWVSAIERLIASGQKTLVAVGSMHLAGPGNVLECLGRPYEAVSVMKTNA